MTNKQTSFTIPLLDAKQWSIICDFDGTIAPFDVTDAVLQEFAPKVWENIEEKWLRGEITARQCMERQIALIETPVALLDAFLDKVPLTEGFPEFVQFCRTRKLRLLIVSDGMDYAIQRVLARHNLSAIPVIANHLLFHGESGYALAFPYGEDGCPSGVCKCRVSRDAGGRILLIGDGRSDCCLAGVASFTLAREGKELERHCLAQGYPHRLFSNFFDILADMEKIGGQYENQEN
ncbi:2,3-diketo-5-methylthio-1-phosphopentane phosphatase [Deltaproteobacteria bacterium]|nr:2,3-diketo-5-methylthio-1-phosphopentane phosphatase [Deltaproteobacteria bacterium]